MAGTTQPDDGVVPFPSHAAERERERERDTEERDTERERERDRIPPDESQREQRQAIERWEM